LLIKDKGQEDFFAGQEVFRPPLQQMEREMDLPFAFTN